ncbi:hypothetical protein [Ulvibacterium marinum]|uniref:hypothetical protein n=1 Tax=Ulvibacterium marinum TaxID=2419782 RepID=UPI0013140173|nr:hypothetical protein [Ulvibacterium marinum]
MQEKESESKGNALRVNENTVGSSKQKTKKSKSEDKGQDEGKNKSNALEVNENTK